MFFNNCIEKNQNKTHFEEAPPPPTPPTQLPATFEGSVAIIKKAQYDFPKMRGGVKGRLELFRKFIRFGRARLPLGKPQHKNIAVHLGIARLGRGV